jgi:hypothetical protein
MRYSSYGSLVAAERDRTCETEDVWVPEDLLKQGELALGVLPVAVEQIHGEGALNISIRISRHRLRKSPERPIQSKKQSVCTIQKTVVVKKSPGILGFEDPV